MFFFVLSSQKPLQKKEIFKPLLRVFPIFRKEECDWSIRFFICVRCMEQNKRYAQKIYFYESGIYRVHGCYSEKIGFEKILDEMKNNR